MNRDFMKQSFNWVKQLKCQLWGAIVGFFKKSVAWAGSLWARKPKLKDSDLWQMPHGGWVATSSGARRLVYGLVYVVTEAATVAWNWIKKTASSIKVFCVTYCTKEVLLSPVAYALYALIVLGLLIYVRYRSDVASFYALFIKNQATVQFKEDTQHMLGQIQKQFEEHITATDKRLEKMEQTLTAREEKVKKELDEKIGQHVTIQEQKRALENMNKQLKANLVSVEQHLKALEQKFPKQEKQLETKINKQVAAQAENQKNAFKNLQKELQSSLVVVEKQLKGLDKKIETEKQTVEEKLNEQVQLVDDVKQSVGKVDEKVAEKIDTIDQRVNAVEKREIDATIKNEVSGQFGALRSEIKEREAKKKAKKKHKELFDRFLEQLASENED